MPDSTKTTKGKVRRKAIRFQDSSLSSATLNDTIPVLVFSESSSGCGLAVLSGSCPEVGDKIGVKLGTINNIPGVVRWKKKPCEEISLIGVEFARG